jgi:hypothetical protein
VVVRAAGAQDLVRLAKSGDLGHTEAMSSSVVIIR